MRFQSRSVGQVNGARRDVVDGGALVVAGRRRRPGEKSEEARSGIGGGTRIARGPWRSPARRRRATIRQARRQGRGRTVSGTRCGRRPARRRTRRARATAARRAQPGRAAANSGGRAGGSGAAASTRATSRSGGRGTSGAARTGAAEAVPPPRGLRRAARAPARTLGVGPEIDQRAVRIGLALRRRGEGAAAKAIRPPYGLATRRAGGESAAERATTICGAETGGVDSTHAPNPAVKVSAAQPQSNGRRIAFESRSRSNKAPSKIGSYSCICDSRLRSRTGVNLKETSSRSINRARAACGRRAGWRSTRASRRRRSAGDAT